MSEIILLLLFTHKCHMLLSLTQKCHQNINRFLHTCAKMSHKDNVTYTFRCHTKTSADTFKCAKISQRECFAFTFRCHIKTTDALKPVHKCHTKIIQCCSDLSRFSLVDDVPAPDLHTHAAQGFLR